MTVYIQTPQGPFTRPVHYVSGVLGKDRGNRAPVKKVVFVLLENFSMASFTGAVDVLVTANLVAQRSIFEVITCSLHGDKVASDLGIDISVTTTIAAYVKTPFDVLVVCGGLRTPIKDDVVLGRLISKSIHENRWMGSLWNGAYFMASEGVFDKHECSVHPDTRDLMKERYPDCKLSRFPYVFDGKVFSCAGSNGVTSVMLDMLGRMIDQDLKAKVNRILMGDINKPLNTAFLSGIEYLPQKLELVTDLMESNLEEPLELSELCQHVSISRRQLERLFSKYLNISPSRYYLELRVEKGRQLLLKTNYSIGEISVACGFTNQTHFSHSFKALYGHSPTQARFARAA